MDISGIPRLKYYAYYDGEARLVNGRYTLTVDVNDGLRCLPGYSMPTRDTYTWDPVTLAGEINSAYDVGCFGGPPGTQFWTFALQRLYGHTLGGATNPPSTSSTSRPTASVVRSSR